MNKWAARGLALGLWLAFVVLFGLLPIAPRSLFFGLVAVWHVGVGVVSVLPSTDLKLPGRIGMALLVALLSAATGLVGAAMLAG